MSSKNWGIAQLWNLSLDSVPQRDYEPRDYVWASELGGSFYDRYWKMKGRQPTTPPTLRARRKFEGGNLIEWVILQVLNRAAVLQTTQEHFVYENEFIPVSGRLDFKAGGQIQSADFSDLPETIKGIAESTLAALQEKFPDGLDEVNIEVKSCAGTMFDRYSLAPASQHGLQAFVQAQATNTPTLLVYVSRDDLRIVEWKILPGSDKWLKLLESDLQKMAEVIESNALLQSDITDVTEYSELKEPLLVWSGGKFSSNWKVEYSNYLTDYGYEYPEEYSKPAKSISLRLNNIVKKIKEGKELTKVNLKTLEECYAFYPEALEVISNVKEKYGRPEQL